MSDFRNLAAAPATGSNSIISNLEATTGKRKRDEGNTRRGALNRVLHREHKRMMRDAMLNDTATDTTEENCECCSLSIVSCICCEDCGQLHCQCILDHDMDSDHDHDVGDFRDNCRTCDSYICQCADIAAESSQEIDFDYDPYWYDGFSYTPPRASYFKSDEDIADFLASCGGAFLEEIIIDINEGSELQPIDLEELKLHDYFWPSNTADVYFSTHHYEGNIDMTNRNRNQIDLASFVADLQTERPDMSFELPTQRRKFVVIPGGRTKKIRNRPDNFYSFTSYKRPVARTNGFSHEDVIQFFDDVEHDRRENEMRRRREELALLAANCNSFSGKKGKRNSKRNARQYGEQDPAVSIVVSSVNARRLPPGRVVKQPCGKLVWMVDEQALAA